jgi:pyruvate/2-oxoacid:ferredoxin oxidoreductase beta subunit
MTTALQQVFARPVSLKDVQTHFCPGCHHGTIHRLVAEALDHFAVQEKTIGVASVGCSVFLYGYFDVDVVEAPHGRAPAVATGVKRVHHPAQFSRNRRTYHLTLCVLERLCFCSNWQADRQTPMPTTLWGLC